MAEKVEYILSLKDLFSSKIKSATAGADALDKKMSGLGGGLSGLSSKLAGLGIVFGGGVLAKSIIEVGSSFEMAEVQLKTLLHSSTEAKQVFEDLKKQAVTSPFSFESLLKGNAALISTGINAKQAKGDFDALANAVAATGGGQDELDRMVFNLQQIKNVGATAADIKQFGMAGINIYSLLDKYAAKYNVTIDKHNITYENIIGALKNAQAAGGDYYNALNNMAATTSGKLSNLKDSFKNLSFEIFNALKPALNSLVTGLTAVMDFIRNNLTLLKRLAVTIGIITAAILLYNGAVFVMNTYNTIMAGIMTLKVIGALTQTTTAQWALNAAMAANPIGLVIAALAALAAAIYYVYDANEKFKEQYKKDTTEARIKAEQKQVEVLTQSYIKLGYSKEQATKKALKQEAEDLDYFINTFEKQVADKSLSEKERNIALTNLEDYKAAKESLFKTSFEKGSTVKGGVNSATKDKNLGSAIGDVAGKSPKNLYISIDSLIKGGLNLYSTNVTEGAKKIEEIIKKTLLTAVNDVNVMQ